MVANRCTVASNHLSTAAIHVFDFELTPDQMDQIAGLDNGASSFFDHRDPQMVKWMIGRREE